MFLPKARSTLQLQRTDGATAGCGGEGRLLPMYSSWVQTNVTRSRRVASIEASGLAADAVLVASGAGF
jgi:hypothetical protein